MTPRRLHVSCRFFVLFALAGCASGVPDGDDGGRRDGGPPPEGCGNGNVEGDEECDDGNEDNTDLCLDLVAARCGTA
ncbi:MAG: hypothetical protein R3B99_05905 [Polyangiales bacterium]